MKTNLHLEIELSALMRADKELESAQDYTRGDTKLKPIRDSISVRIRELETALAEPSNVVREPSRTHDTQQPET